MLAFLLLLLSGLLCCIGQVSIGDRVIVNFFAQVDLPLNRTEAEAEGWTLVSSDCDVLYGYRYRLLPRLSPTLLYDSLGQIAGIQFTINTTKYPVYPDSSVVSSPYLIDPVDPNLWIATAHFSDPSLLCSGTMPLPQGSVGDRVWARIGSTNVLADSFDPLPLSRKEIRPEDGWVKGGCLPSKSLPTTDHGMGQHYWRNFHTRMPLASPGFPWFLVYDQHDELRMFGITLGGPLPVYPTLSGLMDNTWRTNPVPIPGPNKYFYPNARTNELWTYPMQPLIPFFHLHDSMPQELLFLNLNNASLPCGTHSTATLHVVLKDSSNITQGACQYDHTDPRNAIQSADQVRALYGQPDYSPKAEGVWDLNTVCRQEVKDSQFGKM